MEISEEPMDSGLRCPECQYNLTGLPDDRCPECGREFDRAALLKRMSEAELPATPWDEKPGVRTLLQSILFIAWRPREFARAFPRRHMERRARTFTLACYAAATIIVWGGSLLVALVLWPRDGVFMVMAVMSCAWGASGACRLCEVLIAGLLAATMTPDVAAPGYRFWRGLVNYTSGFTLLTGAWGALLFMLIVSDSLRFRASWLARELDVALWTLGLAIFVWWWAHVARLVSCRAQHGSRRWPPWIIDPICGGVAIVCGIILSFVVTGCVVSPFVR